MSVNNVAFKKEDEKVSPIIEEIFRSYSTKDVVPIIIKEQKFICILSISNVDMSTLEGLVRKAKCTFTISTGHIIGTSIPINVAVITSIQEVNYVFTKK